MSEERQRLLKRQRDKRYDAKRRMAQYRQWYRTPEWKQLRAQHKAEHPYCAVCLELGKHMLGHSVDHIVPHKGNHFLFFSANNLQHLCENHHNSMKQHQERGRFLPVGVDGWPKG